MSGERHNMEIVLASRNAHKIKEIGAVLGRCGLDGIKLLSLDDIGFTGEIDETGATFAENAVIKASVPASMGYVSIADDSGLEVDYLDGEPGVIRQDTRASRATTTTTTESFLKSWTGFRKKSAGQSSSRSSLLSARLITALTSPSAGSVRERYLLRGGDMTASGTIRCFICRSSERHMPRSRRRRKTQSATGVRP